MADETMTQSPMDTQPGDDEAVSPDADLTILEASRAYKHEAEQARRTRLIKNRRNRDAYMAEADYSHKTKGQSREFLPKTPMAIESFSAFFKKALVGFGDWFAAEGPPGDPIAPHLIRKILLCYLETCGPHGEPFATQVSDGVKTGALESLMIFKVHGRLETQTQYHVERGLEAGEVAGQLAPRVTESLGRRDVRSWRLLIDLIPPKDYYPDPTGRGLYEIHEVERDYADVLAWAEAGVYDLAAVEQIDADFVRQEDEAEQARLKGQDQATSPGFRRRVVIQEFYGTILDADGRPVHRNAIWAIANDRYVIRKPTPLFEVFWHGESPIEAIPLIRVPGSTWHKALADNMTNLNTALNELFNLMMDGGLASVWGTRQIRTDWLEDPRQVSDGIPQGMTLQVNSNCPPGEKVMETVTTGQVPQDAMAMFAQTDREFQSASLSNELQLGQLPSKQVRATEVVAAETSRAVTVDGLVRDVEKGIERVLRKGWLVLLQHADDLATDDVVAAIGPRAALELARMSPAERFSRYASHCKFKVFGLSAVLARAQDFQKKAALLGLISTNPLMMQAFMAKYSLGKTLDSVLKDLNISPDALLADEMEMAQRPEMMAQLPMFQQLAGVKREGGNGVPGMANDTTGAVGAQANAQMSNPLAELGV
jgi:hypothetical protein